MRGSKWSHIYVIYIYNLARLQFQWHITNYLEDISFFTHVTVGEQTACLITLIHGAFLGLSAAKMRLQKIQEDSSTDLGIVLWECYTLRCQSVSMRITCVLTKDPTSSHGSERVPKVPRIESLQYWAIWFAVWWFGTFFYFSIYWE
jgi:hypothetical protein